MPSKLDKPSQNIQEIYKFVSARAEQDETFRQAAEEIEAIQARLEQRKFLAHILSQDADQAQALYQLLSSNENLNAAFEFKFTPLSLTPLQQNPNLQVRLKAKNQFINLASSLNTNIYDLRVLNKLTLGRDPECTISLDATIHTKVSWQHAEIRSVLLEKQSNYPNWEICDLNTTNGTYVNGERIHECRTLKDQDCITLAKPKSEDSVPEFIFELIGEENPESTSDSNLAELEGDILFLIANNEELESIEKYPIFQKFSSSYAAKKFIVNDISGSFGKTSVAAESRSKTYWDSFQRSTSSFSSSNLELVLLNLNEDESKESFLQILLDLVDIQETIFPELIADKANSQLKRISTFFDFKINQVNKEIQKLESELQGLLREDFKEQTKKCLKKANDEKEKFFKQIKTELAQSKAGLLDPYSKKGVLYKIQQFVEELRPVVVKRGSFKYIQLSEAESRREDINISLIRFCSSTIEKWSDEEWKRIFNTYVDGGLNALFLRVFHTLNIIPELLEASSFQPSKTLDAQRSILDSFVGIPGETRYDQEISPLAYVSKQIRANLMQLTFFLTLTAMVGGAAASGGGRKFLNGMISHVTKMPLLFGILIFLIVYFLVYSYQKDSKIKLEDIGEKLKKDLSGHYQSLAKSLTEKISQDISGVLELEERNLKELLETTGEQFTSCIIDRERNNLLIKGQIDQLKAWQKTLEKDKNDFLRLKKS